MRTKVLCAALCAALRTTAAQAPAGSLAGNARDTAGNVPIAFALIRLQSVDRPTADPTIALTDSIGRYSIGGIMAGSYRLQLDRIGFERVVSPVLRLQGSALTYDLLAAPVALRLSAVKVAAPGSCLDAAHLAEDSQLAGLWNEAVKGVESRRALGLAYRFMIVLDQSYKIDRRFLPDVSRRRSDTTTSEPDSVTARLLHLRQTHRSGGYVTTEGGRFLVNVPDETELLDDEFLQDHCLEAPAELSDTGYVLRFRDVQRRTTGYGLRGAIRLDSRFLIERLDFDYVTADTVRIRTNVRYTDVPMLGTTSRMRTWGEIAGRPVALAMVNWVSGTFAYTYSSFARVRP